MDDDAFFQLQRASLGAFYRAISKASPDAELLERDGVVGSLTPGAPNRSITNALVYDRAEQLADALDDLEGRFDQLVNAWTVWVPEPDAESAALLERRGHKLDGAPRVMVMGLEQLKPLKNGEVAVEDIEMRTVGQLNDYAYGFQGLEFERAMQTRPEGMRLYGARVDGEFASCVGIVDCDGDCGVYLVATLPDARGRGLAAALMTRALLEARERGCATTTLQASPMGYPLYERLGYRDIGAMQLWEKRKG